MNPNIAIFYLIISSTMFLSCSRNDLQTISTTPTTPTIDHTVEEIKKDIVSVKIAFIGDTGIKNGAKSVLQLIKDEGAELVLHQGDFDYTDRPDLFEQHINSILGDNFPYLISLGNHDIEKWREYRTLFSLRLERTPDVKCEGEMGILASCFFKEIHIILSSVGIIGIGHPEYIKSQLEKSNSRWRICSWHKNQRTMQPGWKDDETGWEVYERCREEGAIIATAHEHSYGRTYAMNSFENLEVASFNKDILIKKGTSFVFVNGLGGNGMREGNPKLANLPHWASIYNTDHNSIYGALFCEFNINNNNKLTYCYFKNIRKEIIDNFFVINEI